jgi:diacylglycerol kinase family enzyme
VLVVSNPTASATTVRQRDVLVQALSADVELEVAETRNRGHAAALACRAMREGADAVIALGGDGTVNEVVNGLLTDGVHDRVPALGVLPAGSTNVFARALGLPNDTIEATSVVLEAMRAGRRRRISLGRADDRWFVFTAGLGLDADVVTRVEQHRRRGRPSTHPLYVRTTLQTYFGTDRRKPALRIEGPDGLSIDHVHLAIVTNCTPWTYLGNRPLSPTPHASFDAGLDVYLRTRLGIPSMAWGVARIALGRTREREFGARAMHDLETFDVLADRALPLQVDGDSLGRRERVHFSSHRNALSVLM